VLPLAVTEPLVPIEAVPAETFLRGGLKPLVIFGAVFPFDLDGVQAQSDVGRFASVAGQLSKAMMCVRLIVRPDLFVPGTLDVFPGLDH